MGVVFLQGFLPKSVVWYTGAAGMAEGWVEIEAESVCICIAPRILNDSTLL